MGIGERGTICINLLFVMEDNHRISLAFFDNYLVVLVDNIDTFELEDINGSRKLGGIFYYPISMITNKSGNN